MNTCSHCKMEVETAALRCPYCLENLYGNFAFEVGGFFSTVLEWILGTAVVLIILAWIF